MDIASALPWVVLRSEECRCFSDIGKGWLAFIAEDPDDGEGPEVATYCLPSC